MIMNVENSNNFYYFAKLKNISKKFGGTVALENVSISIEEGEIHSIVGENGAGKSTLMKILEGAETADNGGILINGEIIRNPNPRIMKNLGIKMVYQEFSLVPSLTVADNMYLGNEVRRNKLKGFIDQKEMNRKSNEIIDSLELDIPINVTNRISNLTTSQKQIVEIAKSLVGDLKLLILDEPTSSLTSKEIEQLFKLLKHLKEKGIAIIFISHKINEVKNISDNITIMRDGRKIITSKTSSISTDKIIEQMVGREIKYKYITSQNKNIEKEIKLEIKNLTSYFKDEIPLKNINLDIHAGEIVGLFGLIGSGRTELVRAIYGLRPIKEGYIKINNRRIVINSLYIAIKNGIAWVPEDRTQQGLILNMAIVENMTLPIIKRLFKGFIVKRIENDVSLSYINLLSIKTKNLNDKVKSLSGGNQQKVVLAKWLATNPQVLILDEPTRGIDVGSKAEIHSIIRKLRKERMAVLFISSELPELLSISDNFYVMREGTISEKINRDNISEQILLNIALGVIN